jgi:hypothetical protein
MPAGAGVGGGGGRRPAVGWRRHRAGIVVPALGAALALAACGDEEGRSRLLGEPEPTPVETTKGGTTVTSAPDAWAEGRAVSASDVSGLEGSAFTAGSVVFVPEDQAGAVAAMAGTDSASRVGCATPASRSTRRRWPVWGRRRRPSTAAVASRSTWPPVATWSAWPTSSPHSPGPPYSAVGCDHIDLPDAAALVVSFGEGGVEAALE